jgi:hypothetical protein
VPFRLAVMQQVSKFVTYNKVRKCELWRRQKDKTQQTVAPVIICVVLHDSDSGR